MKYYLENQKYKVEFECFGAEIKSVWNKETKSEQLWSANPKFWAKTAPFLFPFIGKLKDEQYRYKGQTYPADKHGFGQRVVYKMISQKEDSIRFQLKDTPEIREKYPFPFSLIIEYILQDNTIQENWYVENTGEEPMYFSIGGHGAFACPVISREDDKNLSLEARKKRVGQKIKLYGLEDREEIMSYRLNDKGLITEKLLPISLTKGCFTITEDLFSADALIFDQENISAVSLMDENNQEYIRLESDAPVWGIWSHPDSNAGYVCLEPWHGICDFEGYEGSLEERPHTQTVLPGETWSHGITMIFQ